MITILFCTNIIGYNGGIGRVNFQILQHLDRSKISPQLLIMNEPTQLTLPQDLNAPILFLGNDFRFQSMLKAMRDVDIVHFTTGFDPTLIEAARVSEVPVLIEANHNLVPEQTFPNIDTTICISKKMQNLQPIPLKTTNHAGVTSMGNNETRCQKAG